MKSRAIGKCPFPAIARPYLSPKIERDTRRRGAGRTTATNLSRHPLRRDRGKTTTRPGGSRTAMKSLIAPLAVLAVLAATPGRRWPPHRNIARSMRANTPTSSPLAAGETARLGAEDPGRGLLPLPQHGSRSRRCRRRRPISARRSTRRSGRAAGARSRAAAGRPHRRPRRPPTTPRRHRRHRPATPASKTADSSPVKRSYTSGEQPWTPAWAAWCREHFPHSFNEKDGTILPFGAPSGACK